MKKIILICEAFRIPSTYVRWRMLTEINPQLEVILIAPKYSEDYTWPDVRIFETSEVHEERFRVLTIEMRRTKFTKNGFLSWNLFRILVKERPDILYMIGYEVDNILLQLYFTKMFWGYNCKVIGFTMRGLPFPLHILSYRLRWFVSTRLFDAICCHYPKAIEIIRDQGHYKGPIYMQTQIGVDKNIHYFSEERKISARNKFGIKRNEFIFGIACRLENSKGIFEVLDALPNRADYRLLVLGDGKDKEQFLKKIREKKLEDKIIYPGFVAMGEGVAEALCAMNVFIHVPKTTPNWVDTFPLVVVQAMATKLPVIGSDSGAVPYQIGDNRLIVPESNPQELQKKMIYFLENQREASEIGEKLYQRVLNTFEISHLTKCFNLIVEDILSKKWINGHQDQAKFEF